MVNEMMDRPIIQADVLSFLRVNQRPFGGKLKALQDFANDNKMPIIPHETAVFLQFFLQTLKPQNILEVGTAIGFSAALMALATPDDTHITTIDRYKLMSTRARENFANMGLDERITLIDGDAEDLLPKMSEDASCDNKFDFIFLDCAKSKYIQFLPFCLKMLADDGVIMIDDIFQAGTIFDDPSIVKHRRRRIFEGLNQLLVEANTNPELISTSIPLGDGILLIRRKT
ncbi:MAG: O-methyltransferase [Candidatus Ancillula sp.]|nr:O-methyltransferase [Candidatus Ancillula sp.]